LYTTEGVVDLPAGVWSSEPDGDDPGPVVENVPGTTGCDRGRLGEGETLPSGICSLRAMFWACTVWPADTDFIKSGLLSANICNALIEPHSMILLLSQSRDTGFVRKSLQPAASAATLSDCNDDAVKATMMTEERKGLEDMRESFETSDGVR